MRFRLTRISPPISPSDDKHGHDALSVTDQGLGGSSDPQVAAICKSEGRALVTLDVGFADIRAYHLKNTQA